MTRVSDALARAAQNPAADVPVAETGPDFPVEAPAEIWTTEHPGGGSTRLDDHPGEPPAPASTTLTTLSGSLTQEKLVTGLTVERASVEQYRRLAARLHLAQAEHGTRVVMITSAVASEGKTLTATNLALTLSESYNRRVLLIDADLRRPWVHELFRVPNLTGLNDGIRADTERKVPLIRVSEYLSVLTAGRPDPDPMSVLASDRMRRVLADAARSFDWVIVDTPPVAVLSDAHLLAALVDTVVLVIKAGSTQFAAMNQAVTAVGRDRILGVVLNCADEGRHAAYNYYGYASGAGKAATT
jgi:capsular exopolysaccharide synthesis family protein